MFKFNILLSFCIVLLCVYMNPGKAENSAYSATEQVQYANALKTYNLGCKQPFTDLILHDIQTYRINISKRIVEAWSFFENSATSSPILRIVIQKDGSLSELTVVSSSGNPEVDQKAITTLQALKPFPPLPSNYPFPNREMIVDFHLMHSLVLKEVKSPVNTKLLSRRMTKAVHAKYKVVPGVGDRMGVILAQVNLENGEVVNKRVLVTSCAPQYDAEILNAVDQASPFQVLDREKHIFLPEPRIVTAVFVFKQSYHTPANYYPTYQFRF